MGVDFSVTAGVGVKLDRDAVKRLPDYEDCGGYEALDNALWGSKYLSYSAAGSYYQDDAVDHFVWISSTVFSLDQDDSPYKEIPLRKIKKKALKEMDEFLDSIGQVDKTLKTYITSLWH